MTAAQIAYAVNHCCPEWVATPHEGEVWLYRWLSQPKLSAAIKAHHNVGGIPDYRVVFHLDAKRPTPGRG